MPADTNFFSPFSKDESPPVDRKWTSKRAYPKFRTSSPGVYNRIHLVEKQLEYIVRERAKNRPRTDAVVMNWRNPSRKKYIGTSKNFDAVRAEIVRHSKKEWEARIIIGDCVIVAIGRCRQTALWTAWDSSDAKNARNDVGIPHKLDWNNL